MDAKKNLAAVPQACAKAATIRLAPHEGLGLRFSIFKLDGSLDNINFIPIVVLLKKTKAGEGRAIHLSSPMSPSVGK